MLVKTHATRPEGAGQVDPWNEALSRRWRPAAAAGRGRRARRSCAATPTRGRRTRSAPSGAPAAGRRDEGVPGLGLVGCAFGEPEMPGGVLLPRMPFEIARSGLRHAAAPRPSRCRGRTAASISRCSWRPPRVHAYLAMGCRLSDLMLQAPRSGSPGESQPVVDADHEAARVILRQLSQPVSRPRRGSPAGSPRRAGHSSRFAASSRPPQLGS